MKADDFRSGFVAVVGRPNTGKSTLVNALVAEKISIVTSRPQTTRHRILGIVTEAHRQFALVDTPGLHAAAGRLINRAMNRAATASLVGADIALMVIEATGWQRGDDYVLERVVDAGLPFILVVNKIDRLKPRSALLPFIAECSERANPSDIVPVSALHGDNLDRLVDVIGRHLPRQPAMFPADARTDKSMEFRIAEILREKLMEQLHAEVPYGLAVEVDALAERDDLLLVDAIIWIEKESHKGIVIGKGGERLKRVGTTARKELETLFGRRFHIQTRVRLKENWSDNARVLRQLGYEVSQ